MSTNSEASTGGVEPLWKRLVMRCATCRYWQGDKEKALKMLKENPPSMDLYNGWPEDGSCLIDYEWISTEINGDYEWKSAEINGDAAVYNTVYANFGCVYWSA